MTPDFSGIDYAVRAYDMFMDMYKNANDFIQELLWHMSKDDDLSYVRHGDIIQLETCIDGQYDCKFCIATFDDKNHAHFWLKVDDDWQDIGMNYHTRVYIIHSESIASRWQDYQNYKDKQEQIAIDKATNITMTVFDYKMLIKRLQTLEYAVSKISPNVVNILHKVYYNTGYNDMHNYAKDIAKQDKDYGSLQDLLTAKLEQVNATGVQSNK